MATPQHFGRLWGSCQLIVTATYVCFGAVGYRAWGDDVHSIVTIEMPAGGPASAAVLGFCVAMCAAPRLAWLRWCVRGAGPA